MAASILFIRVTRSVFADDVGGLDRMAGDQGPFTKCYVMFVKVVIRETTFGDV